MSTCYTKWQPTQYFPQLVMAAFLSPTYLLATIPGFGISHLPPDCLCDPYFNPEISLEPQLYPQGALISTLKSLSVRVGRVFQLSANPLISQKIAASLEFWLSPIFLKIRSIILRALWELKIPAGLAVA